MPVPRRSPARIGAIATLTELNLLAVSCSLAWPLRPSRSCRRLAAEAHRLPRSHGPRNGNAIASKGQRKVNRTAVASTRQSTCKVPRLSDMGAGIKSGMTSAGEFSVRPMRYSGALGSLRHLVHRADARGREASGALPGALRSAREAREKRASPQRLRSVHQPACAVTRRLFHRVQGLCGASSADLPPHPQLGRDLHRQHRRVFRGLPSKRPDRHRGAAVGLSQLLALRAGGHRAVGA